MEKLQSRLEEMQQALDEERFDELAGYAHWLRGTAGSVGFSVFTEPANELESAARSGLAGPAGNCMETLWEMKRRIRIPAADGSEANNLCTIESP